MNRFKKIILAITLILVITFLLIIHLFLLGYANKPEEHNFMINFNVIIFYLIHFSISYFITKKYFNFKFDYIDFFINITLYFCSYFYLFNFT